MTLPVGVTSLLQNLEGHQSHLDIIRKDAAASSLTGHSLGMGGRAGRQVSGFTAQVTVMHSKVRNPRLHFQREKNN